MRCYFDGSAGGQSEEWLTLGGLAGSGETWIAIEQAWTAMLRARQPIASHLHMTDLVTGNNGFSRNDGWGTSEVRKLVADAVSLLASFRYQISAFACAVDRNACSRLVADGFEIPDPAVICAETGIGHLLSSYFESRQIETVSLYYDQNEKFIHPVRQRFLRSRKKRALVSGDLFWATLASVEPLNMRDNPGIQAADLVAWSFTRRLRNAVGDEWIALADTLLGTREKIGLLTNTQVGPITENILRDKHENSR